MKRFAFLMASCSCAIAILLSCDKAAKKAPAASSARMTAQDMKSQTELLGEGIMARVIAYRAANGAYPESLSLLSYYDNQVVPPPLLGTKKWEYQVVRGEETVVILRYGVLSVGGALYPAGSITSLKPTEWEYSDAM